MAVWGGEDARRNRNRLCPVTSAPVTA